DSPRTRVVHRCSPGLVIGCRISRDYRTRDRCRSTSLGPRCADRPEEGYVVYRFLGYTLEPPRRVTPEGGRWEHEIQVALPPSYHSSDQRYPVLWVTDGSIWFEPAVNAVSLTAAGHVPEMIVVGVGVPPEAADQYGPRRSYDFTPVTRL